MTHPAFALLERVTTLAAARHATAAAVAARLALAPDPLAMTAPAWSGVPALPGAAFARVRATATGRIDLIALELGPDGPTRAQVEAALGIGREQPPMPGARGVRLAFARQGGGDRAPVSVFADVDDATGRATALLVRRDAPPPPG